MQDLTISLLQTEVHWEQPERNRQHFAELLQGLAGQTGLAILPEMFTTGFSMNSRELAEERAGPTEEWMKQQAGLHKLAITGSLAVRDAGRIFNRLLFVTPGGEVSRYDKRHLFRVSGEHRHYGAGKQRLVVNWRGWRLCPLICYDLRFPVWSRDRDDYDALIYVANWPAKRAMHWRQLLIARAIENQSYCIGLNRVGRDGNNISYQGGSLVAAADGELLLDCKDGGGVFSCTLSASARETYRRKFPSHLDGDDFELLGG